MFTKIEKWVYEHSVYLPENKAFGRIENGFALFFICKSKEEKIKVYLRIFPEAPSVFLLYNQVLLLVMKVFAKLRSLV